MTGKNVAIKMLKEELDDQDLREIDYMWELNDHPNIVTLLDVAHDFKSNKTCLIMELIKSSGNFRHIAKKGVKPKQLKSLMR